MIRTIMRFKLPITAIIVGLILVFVIFARGRPLATYRPGWEVASEIVAMDEINYEKVLRKYESLSVIQDDFDIYDGGLPDIQVQVSDVYEITDKMPYLPLEQDYGKFKYIIESHEYLFDAKIMTSATVKLDRVTVTHVWDHETSLPVQWMKNLGLQGVDEPSKIGKPFEGNVYTRFSCLPWGIPNYAIDNKNYSFNGYWLGIMSAVVESDIYGRIEGSPEPSPIAQPATKKIMSSNLNMFQDDGKYADPYKNIEWDISKVLDPDIKNTVIIQIPFNVLAGAHAIFDVRYNLWVGSITELKPVDVFVLYTIRVDALVVKEYEFRDPAIPPNPSPIEVPKEYTPATELSFFEKYGLWIIIGFIIILIVVWVFASIAGIGFFSLLSGPFRFTKGVKWKT